MEGITLILIGIAIFAHSWLQLGLYSDGRTVGATTASLAGALVLAIFVFQPDSRLMEAMIEATGRSELVVWNTLLLAWGVYMIIVAAQGVWDLEERAIGFYSVPLTVISIVALVFYILVWVAVGSDGDAFAMVSVVVSTALLGIVGALLFFQMAIPFPGLQRVAGWIMLLGSIVIVGLGAAMIFPAVSM